MLGAIFGDIVGSAYEFNNTHDYNFDLFKHYSRFTDDTVMTLAVAKGLMDSYGKSDDEIRNAIIDSMKQLGHRYPNAGYGEMFYHWVLSDDRKPYNSFGNGSAMRVSSAGWMYDTLEETLHAAKLTAEVTHNHPEGIKGAQAVAAAIYLARTGQNDVIDFIKKRFNYQLGFMEDIVSHGHGKEICQITVPQALICFAESYSFITAIRNSVCIGGDSDTIACIAGSIAEAYYGMDEEYVGEVLFRLPDDLKQILTDFEHYKKNRVQ